MGPESSQIDVNTSRWDFRVNTVLTIPRLDPFTHSLAASLRDVAAHTSEMTKEDLMQRLAVAKAIRQLGHIAYVDAQDVEEVLGMVPGIPRLFPYKVPLLNSSRTRCALGALGMIAPDPESLNELRYGFFELATPDAGTNAHISMYFGTADRVGAGYEIIGNIQRMQENDGEKLCEWVLGIDCCTDEILRAASLPGNQ